MTVADTIVGGWAPGSHWLLTPTPLLGPGQARSCAQRGQARASAEQHPKLHEGKCGCMILAALVMSLCLGTNVRLTGYLQPGSSIHCIFLPNHPLDA